MQLLKIDFLELYLMTKFRSNYVWLLISLSFRLIINDNPVTVAPSSYPYKCYISNVLTYSTEVKSAQLQTQGFYPDTSEHMEASSDNAGFTDRMSLFRKKFDLFFKKCEKVFLSG